MPSKYVLRRMSLGWYGLGSLMVIAGLPGIAGTCYLVGTVCAALALDDEE